MKAITTRYHGATDTRGSRITASAEGGHRVTVSYDDASRNPHADAAIALCKKLNWTGKLIEGGLSNQDHVFVFLPSDLMLASKGRMSSDVIDLAAHGCRDYSRRLCSEQPETL